MCSYLPKRLFHVYFLTQRTFSSFYLKQSIRTNLLSPSIRNDLQTILHKNIRLGSPCLTIQDQYVEFSQSLENIPYVKLMDDGLGDVRSDLIENESPAIQDALQWTTEVFDYNVTKGKKIRAIALLKAYAAYGFEDLSLKQYDASAWKCAVVLAWCIEMLQAFFLIADDIMDQSKIRRGAPCWYQHPNVGLCAINDSIMLQSGVYKLIEKHFKHKKSYLPVLEEFLKVTQKTVYGQCIDMLSNPPNQSPKLENFTFERYKTLVEYKTSNYTYCLPVHLAMHLVGGFSESDFQQSKDLCLKLGLYFQSQDDYLDCFGDPKVTGKFSNDINEGKCTWFAVKFLEVASPELKEEFKKHFAINDKKSISKVLELYEQVSLRKKFDEFDSALSLDIQSSIESLNNLQAGLFYNLFSQITKRDK